jgi:hypothetical protein
MAKSIPSAVRLREARLFETPTFTRMPFRFGIAVMTEAPHVFLHATFDVDGRTANGIAAEGLLPKWFDKDPAKRVQDEIVEMLLVIRQAAKFAESLPALPVFRFWRAVYDAQLAWARTAGLPPLLAHFGVSLLERAAIDAVARATATPFAGLLQNNALGIALGEIHPELAGLEPGRLLPARPLAHIVARHTVGLSDPLRAADLAAAERLADGLPQTLEECIRYYGLHHFKLKLCGNAATDLLRLREIAAVISEQCGENYAFTLDGNEQYKEFGVFTSLWDDIQADARLRAFFRKLLFVEQPLHRAVALDPSVARIRDWAGGPPMIIDESDAEIGDLARALELGYAGTSHKNCKGVIKGVAHRCLLNHRNAAAAPPRHVMSGEDLVNIGPVALLQDLAVQAALGNESVERNGHHYYRGLAAFPAELNAGMLEYHSDLYSELPDDRGAARIATLAIAHGRLSVQSINDSPFGYRAPLDLRPFAMLPA